MTPNSTLPYYLLIDTSTEACSLALAHGDKIVAQELEQEAGRHSSSIGTFAQSLLTLLPEGEQLSAVAVAEGPGSYTGLRIAASFAKGLCLAQGLPLVAVSTLEIIVQRLITTHTLPADSLIMPMIDARRLEVYTALYTVQGEPLCAPIALILDDETGWQQLHPLIAGRSLVYCGNGSAKAVELMAQRFDNAQHVDGVISEAQAMLPSLRRCLSQGELCDVAYWTPFYLKEYEAKLSVNKVLGQVRTS